MQKSAATEDMKTKKYCQHGQLREKEIKVKKGTREDRGHPKGKK